MSINGSHNHSILPNEQTVGLAKAAIPHHGRRTQTTQLVRLSAILTPATDLEEGVFASELRAGVQLED